MSSETELPPDEGTVEELGDERAGARARALHVIRNGFPRLHQSVGNRRQELAQYRAAISLLWDRERILSETGWSNTKLASIEHDAREEAKRTAAQLDPRVVYAEYKAQQLQAAAELENLAVTFRRSSQFNSLVAAIKTRSEILERVLRMGQDLGLISRAAREVSVTATVDVRKLSVSELRVELAREVRDLNRLLRPMPQVEGVAGTVLRRVLQPTSRDTEASPEQDRTPRTKRTALPRP